MSSSTARRFVTLAASALLAAFLLSACGTSTPSKPHALTVTVTNGGVFGTSSWQTVTGENGTLTVTIANQSGTVIATGGPVWYGSPLMFHVPIESFYQITIGSYSAVSFSEAQLKSDGWQAQISVG